MSQIRVLLVDDNSDFLEGVSAWLAGEDGIEVVGTARSGREAIEQVERLRPDLVLTDGTMPEMDGFEATRRIKSNPEPPKVVLMTFHDSEAVRNEAWVAGADGFITKADVTGDLMALVRNLVDGRRAPEATSERKFPKKSPKPGPTSDL